MTQQIQSLFLISIMGKTAEGISELTFDHENGLIAKQSDQFLNDFGMPDDNIS